MYITVIDETTAESLCRMNNFNFGAATVSVNTTIHRNLLTITIQLHITRGGGSGGQLGGNNNRGGFNRGGAAGGGAGNLGRNNNNNSNVGRSDVLAEFLQERWNPQAGFLDMDELPPTSHNISVVISRLLNEAKYLYGENVSRSVILARKIPY